MLQGIIPSKARREILRLFYINHDQSYHLRRVSRELDLEINAVKRELDILEKSKVLLKEKRLNKSVYSLNTAYLFYDEFLRVFAKESDISRAFLKQKIRLGKIDYLAISLKLIQKVEIQAGQVYILIVGSVISSEVESVIHSVESQYPFEVNYTIMTKDEFAYRKKQNDPFIWDFLKQAKIMLVGSETKLMS